AMEHVEDRVHNLADVHLAPTPTAFGRRYRRFDQCPLAVAQITRVAQAVAVGSTAVFRLPHSAPSASTRVPEKESQPIPPTQQLYGSALRSEGEKRLGVRPQAESGRELSVIAVYPSAISASTPPLRKASRPGLKF